jgi:sugar lactone lactonase YvrE
VLAHCEYPNGLALSPDERIRYVANTRSSEYIHAIKLDAAGNMVARSIFADLNEGSEAGIPDGLSVGRVYCTGPGGMWAIAPDGKRLDITRWPEQAVNFAFGGPDYELCCAAPIPPFTRFELRRRAIRIHGTNPSASERARPRQNRESRRRGGLTALRPLLSSSRTTSMPFSSPQPNNPPQSWWCAGVLPPP